MRSVREAAFVEGGGPVEEWIAVGYLWKKWRWLIKKIIKWARGGLVLSFVIWFVAAWTGLGPAVESLVSRAFQLLGLVQDVRSKYL